MGAVASITSRLEQLTADDRPSRAPFPSKRVKGSVPDGDNFVSVRPN